MVSLLLLVVLALDRWCYLGYAQRQQSYVILNESEVSSLFTQKKVTTLEEPDQREYENNDENEGGCNTCHLQPYCPSVYFKHTPVFLAGVLVLYVSCYAWFLADLFNNNKDYSHVVSEKSDDDGGEGESMPGRRTHFYVDKRGHAVRAKIIEYK